MKILLLLAILATAAVLTVFGTREIHAWKAAAVPQEIFAQAVERYPMQLEGWTLVIDKDVYGRFGQCRHDLREIGISSYHLEHPRHAVFDTICHELAHAIAGPEAGHSLEWRAWEMSLSGLLVP